jgi:XTP/dITP diphosphohydrolase
MESVAARSLKLRNIRRLIFASHDDPLVNGFREVTEPCGIEVVSLTDVGLPEPSGSTRGPLHSATRKATVVAGITNTPAIGHVRGFYIDPLLRWGGGGPKWSWSLPWPYESEDLAAELWQAHNTLDGHGYCGPDDRGAYFRTLLCLTWPDAQCQTFEGRIQGRFGTWGHRNKPGDLVADYFVPDGETAPLASLADRASQLPSDQEQAFEAFRTALSA